MSIRWRTALKAASTTLLAGTVVNGLAAPCSRGSPTTILTERFMSAACAPCWSAANPVRGAMLDWVVPADDDAPLAALAMAEAAARAPGLPTDRAIDRMASLPSAAPVRLRVVEGLAFNGYVGLQLEVTRADPPVAALAGYMALVERIGAGRDGTSVERQLVRAIVGPLSLTELSARRRIRHLAAVRLPAAAQPERLAAVAWIEAADGRIVAFTQSSRADCR